MENTIDAPFRRVQNSAASETSFGEMPAGRKFRESSLFFPVSIAAQTRGPSSHLSNSRQKASNLGNQGLVFPVNFPVFGRRVRTRPRPPPTSLIGASLCARMTYNYRLFPRIWGFVTANISLSYERGAPNWAPSGLNSPFAQ